MWKNLQLSAEAAKDLYEQDTVQELDMSKFLVNLPLRSWYWKETGTELVTDGNMEALNVTAWPSGLSAVITKEAGAMRAGPATVAEYLEARTPRLPSFPHTSPAYDQVTQPTEAPYPAACVRMGDKCKCYTQQATLLQTPVAVCDQIVKEGYFVDWRQREASDSQRTARPSQDVAQHDQKQSARSLPAPMPAASPAPVAPPVSQWSQGLAARNAEVRSALQ